MPGFLKEKFDSYAEKKRLEAENKQAIVDVMSAIKDPASDLETIMTIADNIRHIRGDDAKSIYDAVFARDDMDIFSVMLGKLSNGNTMAHVEYVSSFGPEGGYFMSSKSMLYAAIEAGAENIALLLATDVSVDPAYSGGYSSDTTHGKYPAPFDTALEKNMPDIAEILKVRLTKKMEQRIAAATPGPR
ncbi:MAG: hypothetical protein H6867_09985 [Rhodospirillales bacterium]|nr:hypothetical protein [Rhodospirillales bacterium]MCB9995887.1 hypothetical protein [Rhodospirillales bacterium]